jgi:hypothetical protein
MKQGTTKLLPRILIALAIVFTMARPASAVNFVYFYEHPIGQAQFYDYDTDTQKATLRTSVSASRLYCLDTRPSDGTVFGLDRSSSPIRLVRIDPNNGQATPIANSGCTSLSFQPGTDRLFGVVTQSLVTINPTNGAVAPIGDFPAQFGASVIEFLADGSLVLYEQFSQSLYMVNPTTAAVTLMGIVPGTQVPRDLGHVGNRLFASRGTGIWEIDVATRNATLLNLPPASILAGYSGIFALPPLPKLSIAVATVSLKWPTAVGTTYQLQYQSPRTTNLWTDLGLPISGTGAEFTVIDSVADDPLRIYRVFSSP